MLEAIFIAPFSIHRGLNLSNLNNLNFQIHLQVKTKPFILGYFPRLVNSEF